MAAWIAAAVLATAVMFWTFGWLSGGSPWPWGTKHAPDLFTVVRSTVTVVALLGGTVAAAIAIRRQRSTEQSVLIAAQAQRTSADAAQAAARAAEVAAEAARVQAQVYELDRERHTGEQIKDLRQRFITAAQQIGNAGSPAVRIAGLYAMTALANDWLTFDLPHEAQTCTDVLCAYLRMPPPQTLVEHMTREYPVHHIASELASELEVRQTAQRLIVEYARRHHGRATAPKIDLTGSHLHDFNAFHVTFNGVRTFFNQATFSGSSTSFVGATFSGKNTSFDGATFSGQRTWFDGATFSGEVTWFGGATFNGERTSFDAVTFSGQRTSFFRATFSGQSISFGGESFSGELPEQLRVWGACHLASEGDREDRTG